jgi:hypothetical protein
MRTRRLRDGVKATARIVAGPSAEQCLMIAREHERLDGYRPDAAVPRRACCVSSAGRAARCCAAGSWW